MRAGLLAIGVLLAAALPAVAQLPDTGATPTSLALMAGALPEPLEPLGPLKVLPLQIAYTHLDTGPQPGGATEVTLAVAAQPAWLVATLSPSLVYVPISSATPPCGCPRTETADVSLLLTTGIDAPAFHAAPVTITAAARINGVFGPSNATAEASVASGYHAQIGATTPTTHFRMGPSGSATVNVTVTNLGNGPTRLAFTVLEAPAGVRVTAPAPVRVGALQTGDASNTATVAWGLATDATFAEGGVRLGVGAAYADGTAPSTDTTQVDLGVTSSVVGAPPIRLAPDVAPAAALLALAGLAWAARRASP